MTDRNTETPRLILNSILHNMSTLKIKYIRLFDIPQGFVNTDESYN